VLAPALFLLTFAVLWAAYQLVLPASWRVAQRAVSRLTRALLRRQRFASWYERGALRLRPLHPYRALLLTLALGFAVAATVGTAFVSLAERVQEQSARLQILDHQVWASARLFRSPAATVFFTAWTIIGTAPGLSTIVLLVVGVLWMRGRRWLPLFLVVVTLGGWALNYGLKALFARARPDLSLALRATSGYSFPSGHAQMSVVTFGALAYMVMRTSRSLPARSAALAFASCAVAAISLSRVYLGVHWISDIVAGVAAGLVWLAAAIAVYEVSRRFRALKVVRPAG
jgi:undecaprenyl-diphosphatase